MKIPSKLKIGAHEFKVVIKEYEDCGFLSRSLGEIWVDESLIQSQKEVALFHEIIHAINGELSEAMVDSLAEQLYQVFADNSLLRK